MENWGAAFLLHAVACLFVFVGGLRPFLHHMGTVRPLRAAQARTGRRVITRGARAFAGCAPRSATPRGRVLAPTQICLLYELSTPFMHLRRILIDVGLGHTKLASYVGVRGKEKEGIGWREVSL